MSYKSDLNNKFKRKYLISSSFKMAMLFTFLLTISIMSWTYLIYTSLGIKALNHIIPLSIAIISTVSVVIISYLISVFVVKKINHISISAASIVNSKDFSCRIESYTNWDDLSNLSHILNILFDSVENLLIDIKNVSNNIAHDLKTPLTRLKNRLESLNETYQNEQTYQAVNECNKLLEIFNGLLKLNRLENNAERISKEKVDIYNVITDAVDLYEPIFEEKNITLNLDIKLKKISLDKSLLFQSIINILDNSYKYSDKNTTVSITSKIKDAYYILKISDEGQGINDNNADKIFETFFREEESRTEPGYGLGLSLVKKIILLHNGKITAKNNKDKGLKIIIYLPIH